MYNLRLLDDDQDWSFLRDSSLHPDFDAVESEGGLRYGDKAGKGLLTYLSDKHMR